MAVGLGANRHAGGGQRELSRTRRLDSGAGARDKTRPMTATADLVEQLRARVGQDNPPGDWLLIEQDRVNQFADVTGDHQYIHVDPERAKGTPFGGTIAHGFLTLSLCLMLPRYRADGGEAAPAPAGDSALPRPKMAVNY